MTERNQFLNALGQIIIYVPKRNTTIRKLEFTSFFFSDVFKISIRVYSYFILVNFYFILMCDEKRYYIYLSEDSFHSGFFSEHTDEYLGLIKQRIS